MIRSVLSVCLLLAGMAFSQAIPNPQPKTSTEEPSEGDANAAKAAAAVPADAPVITIPGVCEAAKANSPDCKTVVSKAEFEKLATTLDIPETRKRQLAESYGRLLYLSHEAEKRGLDKGPRFEESMRFRRMQALVEQLSKSLLDEAEKVPDADIEKFYKENPEAFQEAEVLRVFVPRQKTIEPDKDGKAPTEAEQKANEAAMKKEAETLHSRAAAGEDFDKLQKEAFEAGGLKATPPAANMGKIRRVGLPPEHAVVFDLKPGELSAVIEDSGGYFFYKVVSKQQVTLASVKDEIRQTLTGQRMRDEQLKFQNASMPTLNEKYFGGGTPAAPPNAAKPAGPSSAPKKETPNPKPQPK